MNLALRREPANGSIKGELFIDELFFCFTLERPESDDVYVAIPAGTYDVVITYSPRFDRNLPHILNVPGRSAILIHGGNKKQDTKGCVLAGYNEYTDDEIGDNKAVADLTARIVAAISNAQRCRISIIDP